MMGLRHGIVVDSSGSRFANESMPYDQFGREMLRVERQSVAPQRFHLVTDHRSLVRFGLPALGGFPAGSDPPAAWLASGALRTATTLEANARSIAVDPDNLARTVTGYNAFARGETVDVHGRGEAPFDRFWHRGESPAEQYSTVQSPPFYAVEVVLADLGTKGGIMCDARGCALREDGSVIRGLYAAGNTSAPWSADTYPGPGTPIASSMVFGYLAARHAAAIGR
jgi:3-oxosteroid 1-dehydrogenase